MAWPASCRLLEAKVSKYKGDTVGLPWQVLSSLSLPGRQLQNELFLLRHTVRSDQKPLIIRFSLAIAVTHLALFFAQCNPSNDLNICPHAHIWLRFSSLITETSLCNRRRPLQKTTKIRDVTFKQITSEKRLTLNWVWWMSPTLPHIIPNVILQTLTLTRNKTQQ